MLIPQISTARGRNQGGESDSLPFSIAATSPKANSKASEAVQHATNCGLMLLQVKASLNHGEWLPWLKKQQESGAIEFSQQTGSKYMRIAANYNRERNLIEAPSIRAALELLSDKEPTEQQGELIDGEVERQARERLSSI